MSDSAIQISALNKRYKIFSSPKDRILDLFGLGRLSGRKQQEFWALQDINLDIKRGSKVALVGRNGAGKSTLLKIIAGTLKASSGEVLINGKVSALMELGTGFHPEFTGRDNIFASLSYMGIVGSEAKALFEDIVEFSELEDFIHKPVKTYSAGMYARLAFSTSTAVTPEILIIDEILGAGDAYFVNKSMDRMKKLTSKGTTVLFVSHDISSVQKLCSEAIWIDKGRVVLEGHILDVTASYLASIRMQEETRLKARNVRLKQSNAKSLEESIKEELVYVHLITAKGQPVDKHPISKIILYKQDEIVEELELGGPMDSSPSNTLFLIVDPESINWSDPHKEKEKNYRCFENIGAKYQHALFAFKTASLEELEYEISIEYKDVSTEEVFIEFYDGENYSRIGQLRNAADHQWKQERVTIETIERDIDTPQLVHIEQERDINNRIYGSGEVIITKVDFIDEIGKSRNIFTSGGFLKVKVSYYAKERIIRPVFVVAFYLLDGTCVCQLLSNKEGIEIIEIHGDGYVDFYMNPLLLGRGNYIVSIAIFKELSLVDNVEPPAYDLHDRMYEIKVEQPFGVNVELGLVNHPVRWKGGKNG